MQLSAPDSDSTLLLGAVDAGGRVEPKRAAKQDLKTYRAQAADLEVIGEAPIARDDVDGYQILSRLTMDETPRKRWQVFFARGRMLYFLVGEAVPAADYDAVRDDFTHALNSLQFGPVQ